jgi:hypothetical protein
MTREQWRAGVPVTCECGVVFTAHWVSRKLCEACVERHRHESDAGRRDRYTSSIPVRCACGTRLRLNGPDRCSACRGKVRRVARALDAIGREIVPVRFVSGGGANGTGRAR